MLTIRVTTLFRFLPPNATMFLCTMLRRFIVRRNIHEPCWKLMPASICPRSGGIKGSRLLFRRIHRHDISWRNSASALSLLRDCPCSVQSSSIIRSRGSRSKPIYQGKHENMVGSVFLGTPKLERET